LPFGILLDRYGPKTIQSLLLLLAGAGALVFALADGLLGLMVGRALIGLGVALALMAGFKAIVLWFPPDRLTLANGWFVMLGALGAVTATAPAELILLVVGWRGLFALLAAFSAVAALLILVFVPDGCSNVRTAKTPQSISLWTIYTDPRFWRIAPLSALGVGTSWSLQGLWAAPWLEDVEGFDRAEVMQLLSVMAIAVSASGLLLGLAADRLRRSGVRTEPILAFSLGLSMTAQVALVLGWRITAYLLWGVIAGAGAATVLSYTILAGYFPREASGRANAALNLLHVGAAFALQSVTGLIIEQWPQAGARYPVEAHQSALAIGLALQLAALAWFAFSPRRQRAPAMLHTASRSSRGALAWPAAAATHYATAAFPWRRDAERMRKQAAGWRLAAAVSAILCVGLTATLSMTIGRPAVAIHIFDVDVSAHVPDERGPSSVAALLDGPAAVGLARAVEAPPGRAPELLRSALLPPPSIVRLPPATLANSSSPQR
jgi:MFS family permease